MSPATSPDHMTAAERLTKIGRILALGVLRARRRAEREGNPNDSGAPEQVSLDLSARQRGHGGSKNRRGERP